MCWTRCHIHCDNSRVIIMASKAWDRTEDYHIAGSTARFSQVRLLVVLVKDKTGHAWKRERERESLVCCLWSHTELHVTPTNAATDMYLFCSIPRDRGEFVKVSLYTWLSYSEKKRVWFAKNAKKHSIPKKLTIMNTTPAGTRRWTPVIEVHGCVKLSLYT